MADNTKAKVEAVKNTAQAISELQEETGHRPTAQTVQNIIAHQVELISPKKGKE